MQRITRNLALYSPTRFNMDFENRYPVDPRPNQTRDEFLLYLARLEALEALARAEAAMSNRRRRRQVAGENIETDEMGNETYMQE